MKLDVDAEALRRQGVRLLVAFGSRTKGTHRPSSDVDVGVQFGTAEGIGLERLDDVRTTLRANGEIDLVPLDLADPLLLYEVAVDGQPVFESHAGAWEEFRLLAVKRYWDTAWIRKLERQALRDRYGAKVPQDGSQGNRPA